jgi:hypothetical protein
MLDPPDGPSIGKTISNCSSADFLVVAAEEGQYNGVTGTWGRPIWHLLIYLVVRPKGSAFHVPSQEVHKHLNEAELYNSIRLEIISNHILMHCFSIIVVIVILVGIWIVDVRKTVLSVFLPLLTMAWAAAMVRFDFFIHRQVAYLRAIEPLLKEKGLTIPLWESWKQSLQATQLVVPIADLIISLAIVLPTLYILFGPTQQFFRLRQWSGGKVYAWCVSVLIILLFCSLAVIPKIAEWR